MQGHRAEPRFRDAHRRGRRFLGGGFELAGLAYSGQRGDDERADRADTEDRGGKQQDQGLALHALS